MTDRIDPLDLPMELRENIGSNPTENPTMGDIVNARMGRRDAVRGMLAVAAVSTSIAALVGSASRPALAAGLSFNFKEIEAGVDEKHHVAEGYDADILIRWGDPIFKDSPAFDPMKQSAEAQLKQFGYNNDFIGYAPLPRGSDNSDHGILFVNHEYTDEEVMFPGLEGTQDDKKINFKNMTKELAEIEMAAHGASIVEIKRDGKGKWQVIRDSKYNRRISTLRTEMTFSGPAAGHAMLKTSADSSGMKVVGMVNNCAGGMTPWGTMLTAEENFNGYFSGKLTKKYTVVEGDTAEVIATKVSAEIGQKISAKEIKSINKIEAEVEVGKEIDVPSHKNYVALKRYGAPGRWYNWADYQDRFDVVKEPNEVNRFGWMVEVDPYDPNFVPVKHTALGRFKHEGAGVHVNKDGRVVAYMGDDERFDYVYKYVSNGKFDAKAGNANSKLLTDGTLFVAKFDDKGDVAWLPLVQGQGKLTAENGFPDQASVLVNVRMAADLLGATKMDRPEDVDVNPKTNKVYVMLTNNSRRKAEQVDGTNPRADNIWGQVLEIIPPAGDHAATTAKWELLVKAGNPADPKTGASFHSATSKNGFFSCPDNCAVDHRGRLWITTDQGENWAKASGQADGVYAMETEGPNRGLSKKFFQVPVGAEMCGPMFTPKDTTLFVAVQHPATDGTEEYKPFGKKSSFEDPATRWPDFKPGMPPRPSVVAITKKGGGVIGV